MLTWLRASSDKLPGSPGTAIAVLQIVSRWGSNSHETYARYSQITAVTVCYTLVTV